MIDKDLVQVIEGNENNHRASIEEAMITALMRNDHDDFNRLEGLVKQRARLSSLKGGKIE